MKTHSRFEIARKILIFWCLFIGIGAVAGAACMLISPDGSLMGMGPLLPYFQVLPLAEYLFQDFTFPGIALLCVNGLPNLGAAALLWGRRRGGIRWGGIFGGTLMAWITIQFVIFPPNFLSTAYFIFGLIQAATGFAAWVFDRQERFGAEAAALLPPAVTDSRRLVVYFSRMGYVKKAALEAAAAAGGAVYEVKATQRTQGTLGFWWCGRYGMHRWAMPIEPLSIDLSDYDHVTICAPIWVFRLAAPMRSFCQQAAGRIREADYLLLHHQRQAYANAALEMDRLLGLCQTPYLSLCCRQGQIKCRLAGLTPPWEAAKAHVQKPASPN